MSIQAVNWAFQQTGIKPGPKFVLVAMANFANQDGQCYPSIEKLMQLTGASNRTIIDSIRVLESIGKVTKKARGVFGGGRQSNLYQLNIHESEESSFMGNESEEFSQITKVKILHNESEDFSNESEESRTEPLLTIKEPSVKKKNNKKKKLPPSWESLPDDLKSYVSEEIIEAYIDHRKHIKKPVTLYALKLIVKSAIEAMHENLCSADQAIEIAIKSSWHGLEVSWIKNKLQGQSNGKNQGNSKQGFGKQSITDIAQDIYEDINSGKFHAG